MSSCCHPKYDANKRVGVAIGLPHFVWANYQTEAAQSRAYASFECISWRAFNHSPVIAATQSSDIPLLQLKQKTSNCTHLEAGHEYWGSSCALLIAETIIRMGFGRVLYGEYILISPHIDCSRDEACITDVLCILHCLPHVAVEQSQRTSCPATAAFATFGMKKMNFQGERRQQIHSLQHCKLHMTNQHLR